ncbi:uncharacterized protein MELLADRAFT_110517 [Melampsora larici-populina 98AG31]|uniref:Uncharacterized protein n=1 Tax=Melampsora larici-populina (strain 98AG31 / pathotype 3-4-7) TaxID=747676 RepID=F4S033_MELLP|nr:uncharacterized protein MELLADRAFT_110517 [Melampsora larici-populina 98AG31]EGG02010.1 hypothetical protein MELLADRAFT_110517 [Melampsora larici-populina 98AG31]
MTRVPSTYQTHQNLIVTNQRYKSKIHFQHLSVDIELMQSLITNARIAMLVSSFAVPFSSSQPNIRIDHLGIAEWWPHDQFSCSTCDKKFKFTVPFFFDKASVEPNGTPYSQIHRAYRVEVSCRVYDTYKNYPESLSSSYDVSCGVSSEPARSEESLYAAAGNCSSQWSGRAAGSKEEEVKKIARKEVAPGTLAQHEDRLRQPEFRIHMK